MRFNFLRRYSIDHVNLTKTYPYYSVNNKEYPINSSYIHSHICDRNYYNKFATIRMFLINMWLNIYGYKYEYFLSCDVRDIYFQSNPFAWNIGKGVYLAEQTCNFKMYNSYYDVLWIIGYKYGYKYLNNTLINSGVIYGSRNEITRFYNKMTEFMLTRYFKTSDQGIFNLMLYLNDLTYIPLYISQNGYGFVWNLHLELFFNIKTYGFPVNNYIYNLDGSIPPLIHSYNSNTLDVVKYHCKYI